MNKFKKGDKITLDCGYRAFTYDQECEILSVDASLDVFRNPVWTLLVKEPSGKTFNTSFPREVNSDNYE